MKTIGRLGSGSEYTIFDADNFIHKGIMYERDWITGRYYRLDTPCGFYSRLEREGGMARRRVSAALFARLYSECAEMISRSAKGGAA